MKFLESKLKRVYEEVRNGHRVMSPFGMTIEKIGIEIRFDKFELIEIYLQKVNEEINEYKSIREIIGSAESILKNDITSRRAVFYIGRKFNGQEMECLSMIQFLVRENLLYVFVYVRSLDIQRKLPSDVIAVAHAVAPLAVRLNLEVSSLYFYIASAHVYISG